MDISKMHLDKQSVKLRILVYDVGHYETREMIVKQIKDVADEVESMERELDGYRMDKSPTPIQISNLQAIAYHLEQGEDNGGLTREALAAQLRAVADELQCKLKMQSEGIRQMSDAEILACKEIWLLSDNQKIRRGQLLSMQDATLEQQEMANWMLNEGWKK